MRFDTLGGQCFLAHPTHLLMVMEGARFFQPPESDGVGVDATTPPPPHPPRNRAKNYGGGGAGIQIFAGELHAFEANIHRENKSFC